MYSTLIQIYIIFGFTSNEYVPESLIIYHIISAGRLSQRRSAEMKKRKTNFDSKSLIPFY